jgi:hypothetical protein
MDKNIPTKDKAFDEKQAELTAKVSQRLTDLNVNKDWYTNKLLVAKGKWIMAFTAWQDPLTRTRALTIEKNKARREYEALLRMLVEMIKADPSLDDDDRAELGVINKKHGPRNPDPTLIPMLKFILTTIRWISIEFGTKPHGVHGIEFLVKVGGEKPKNADGFDYSAFDTHSPYTLKFEEDERYQVVYIMARYESTTGGKGPWTEIFTVVIP